MSRVAYGPVVSAAHGAVGGVVMRSGGGMATVSGRSGRRKVRSAGTARVTARAAHVTQLWRELSAADRARWDAAAEVLSGGVGRAWGRGRAGFWLFVAKGVERFPFEFGAVPDAPKIAGRTWTPTPRMLRDGEGLYWIGQSEAVGIDQDMTLICGEPYGSSRSRGGGQSLGEASIRGTWGLAEGLSAARDTAGGFGSLVTSAPVTIPQDVVIEAWVYLDSYSGARTWFGLQPGGPHGTINANGDGKLGVFSGSQHDVPFVVPVGEWVHLFAAVIGSTGVAVLGGNGAFAPAAPPITWAGGVGSVWWGSASGHLSSPIVGRIGHAAAWDAPTTDWTPLSSYGGGHGIYRPIFTSPLGVYSVDRLGGGNTPNIIGPWSAATMEGSGALWAGPWAARFGGSEALRLTRARVDVLARRSDRLHAGSSVWRGSLEV